MWNIIWLVLGAIYVIGCLLLIAQNLIKWFYNIKCRKISGCVNEGCKYRGYCRRIRFTEGEIAELRALISQLNDKEVI